MSIWELHNNVAASQERVYALEDELAGEKERIKALKRALEAAAKKARGGRNIQWMEPVFILVDCPRLIKAD